ncbi:MAG: serine O-acetyltransferase EpsC [Bacteroidales bacterium]
MKKYETLIRELNQIRFKKNIKVPSRHLTQQFVDTCSEILFPVNIDQHKDNLQTSKFIKAEYILRSLIYSISETECPEGNQICNNFFEKFPEIASSLMEDAQTIYDFDPAARSVDEVIAGYPGFFSIMVYRLSHVLYNFDIPLIPRLMSEYAHSKTGIEISPGAKIGKSFFIDHGTGIVIGETAIIYDNVKIYQGVTLGAMQVDKSLAQTKRHPTIENNTIIYSNSTILGGDTVIGHDSIVGGNVFLTKSIPPNSIVYQQSEVKIRNQDKKSSPIDFQI